MSKEGNEHVVEETHKEPDPSSQTTNVTSLGATPVLTLPYIPLHITIPIFSGGDNEHSLELEEWITRVKAAFQAWNTPKEQRAQVVIHHLSGEARREVLVLDQDVKDNAEALFKALREAYGDRSTTAALLSKLHSRGQKRGESTRQFALALQELAQRVERRGPAHKMKMDDILCGCFLEGMLPGAVKVAVTRYYRRESKVDFKQLKEEARRIEVEEEEGGQGEYERTQAAIHVVQGGASSGTSSSDPIVNQLTEEMKSLRTVVNQLCQQMGSGYVPPRGGRGRGRPQGAATPNPNWDEAGRPRCFRCGYFGHMIRECQTVLPPPPQQPSTNTQAPTSQASGVHAEQLFYQQGN